MYRMRLLALSVLGLLLSVGAEGAALVSNRKFQKGNLYDTHLPPPKKNHFFLLATSLRKVSKVCKLKDKASFPFVIFLWVSIHAWHFSVQSFQESVPPLTNFFGGNLFDKKRCFFFSALADSPEASGPASPPEPGGVPHQGGRRSHWEHRGRQREPGKFSLVFFKTKTLSLPDMIKKI